MKKQRWKWTKGYYNYCTMCGKKYYVYQETDTLVCSKSCFTAKYGLKWSDLFY